LRSRQIPVITFASTSTGGVGPAAATPQQQEQRTKQEHLQQQWFQQSNVYYSNYPLNRAAEQRRDEEQLQTWFNAPNTQVTPVLGSRVLLTHTATTTTSSSSSIAKYHPVWVSPAAELGVSMNTSVPPLFLGLDSTGAPHFAVQVTKDSAEELSARHAASWLAARAAGPNMSRSDAALVAVASGLAQWNLDTQYHGASGAQTLPRVGGVAQQSTLSAVCVAVMTVCNVLDVFT
jgi:NADH pyrophosphatase NudC (nudix superfamily)